MYAVISDIHGNLAALENVLRDIDQQGIQDVFCLGDIVGYGPDPVACADLVQNRCAFAVMGNHEEAMVHGAYGFHMRAREAIDWTRDQLKPGFFSGLGVKRRWDYLSTLPLRVEREDAVFIHGSPRQPTSEYLMASEVEHKREKYDEVFAGFDRLLFVGHTHLPVVITDRYVIVHPGELEVGAWRFPDDCDQKAIVNVGSVGQPRDRDNRACYVVVDGDTIRWRRITYDIDRTLARFATVDRLHESLAKRLPIGA